MRVEAENPAAAGHLQRIAAILRDNGGHVAADFTVREQGGEFSCAIGERFGEAGRLLVDYPQRLTVPLFLLEWSDDEDRLEPVAGSNRLSVAHRSLLDEWLPLVNEAGKVQQVRRVLPRFAVADWPLRHHLAEGGYPVMREILHPNAAKMVLLGWHSSGGGLHQPRGTPTPEDPDHQSTPAGETAHPPTESPSPSDEPPPPRWRLIPLKHLVNHHPDGADQAPVPGRTAVATSATSDGRETFENYGDLDAMQLLMSFGYVDSAAPLVHSVPVEVDSARLGRVVVRWRAPRNPRWEAAPGLGGLARDIPEVVGRADGIDLRHLTFRPGNRPMVAAFLAMAVQSRAGVGATAAVREAELILDRIIEANVAYYRRLDELVVIAGEEEPITGMLAAVSMLQQQRLAALWTAGAAPSPAAARPPTMPLDRRAGRR